MMQSSRFSLAILLLLVVSGNALLSQPKADAIDAFMKKYLEYHQFNGSVLVAERGKVILKKGYGYANFEWEIPNDPETKFRLGSITKQFTAMLIMQQVERGKIKLDEPVAACLPNYPKMQGEKVTVRQLLTHTSGIPNYTNDVNIRDDRKAYLLETLLATFSGMPLEFQPGSKMSYSNSGYVLLGAILEAVTRKPYERLLQEEIFRPAGIKNSGYDHAEPILRKRASGYQKPVDLVNAGFIDMSLPFSAGAIYSTVEDLFLWDRALYTDAFITEAGKKIYFTPYLGHYAFGWEVQRVPVGRSADSVLAMSHGGGVNGFSTLIVRLPERQHRIVLLDNTSDGRLEEMATGIEGILFDKPYDHARRSLAETVGKLITEKGIDEGIRIYGELKGKTSEYYVSEGELNRLGYQFLQNGNLKESIGIFKLNVEQFPNSWNVYDSLGEAYLADGQTESALANYEKSVQLNPKNAGGIEAVKKLNATKK